jgi:hypothetical protein
MTWHLHRWGKWEDVTDSTRSRSSFGPLGVTTTERDVLLQERRCSICNRAKRRST